MLVACGKGGEDNEAKSSNSNNQKQTFDSEEAMPIPLGARSVGGLEAQLMANHSRQVCSREQSFPTRWQTGRETEEGS